MSLDPFLVVASIAALLVGLSKGGLPAVGMLAVPVLALVISPVAAASLLLPIYVVSDIVGIWLYRRDFSTRNLKILIPASLIGIGIAWSMASMLSDRAVGLLVGLLGIGFCLNTWFGHALGLSAGSAPQPARVGKGLFWGTVSGFTSFVAHAGSPPYQIYVLPQKLPKATYAGTSTLLFAVINAAKIGPYMQLRPYSMADMKTAALLVPAALVGTVLGAWLTQRLADRWFFRLVQAALFAVSVKLVADGVRTLMP